MRSFKVRIPRWFVVSVFRYAAMLDGKSALLSFYSLKASRRVCSIAFWLE